MTIRPILASVIVAAEDTPDTADAVATAGRWQQGDGGLRTFAENGGSVPDETSRQDMLSEIEESLAWVSAHVDEINGGTFPEVMEMATEAENQGVSLADLLISQLESLKSTVTSADTGEVDAVVPDESESIPGVTVTSAADPLTGAIEAFNKTRQKLQAALTSAGDDADRKKKLETVMFKMNELETRAAGNLGSALNAEKDPETAKEAAALIQEADSLTAQATPVQASALVTADVVGDTIRSVVQFTRVNLPKFKGLLSKPEGQAKFRQELERVPGGQEAGRVLPLVQQLAAGALNEEGFVAGLERIFGRNRRNATAAFLEENGMATEDTKVKCGTDGTVHVAGLAKNPMHVAKLAKFAAAEGISLKIVAAFEDEDATCPQCEGPGIPLGALGSRMHYRCRDCGVGFSREDSSLPAFGKNASDEEPAHTDPTVARQDPLVFADSRTAAGPSTEDHVIKVGTQYLVVGEDTSNLNQGGVALSLSSTQKAATRMTRELAKLWLADDRLSRLIVSEVPNGVSAQITRIVPKTAGGPAGGPGHFAPPPQPPTAAGNHAGPANPVNPTGQPAPGTPPPVAPAPVQVPVNQGPAVNHINPGSPKPPVAQQASADDISDIFQSLIEDAGKRWFAICYSPASEQGAGAPSCSADSWREMKVLVEDMVEQNGGTDLTLHKKSPGQWIMGTMGTGNVYAVIHDNQTYGTTKTSTDDRINERIDTLDQIHSGQGARGRWPEHHPDAIERAADSMLNFFDNVGDAIIWVRDQFAQKGKGKKRSSTHIASEGTLGGLLSEAEGTISQLQELVDAALAKARLLNDESLVAAAERMSTAVFEAGMASRHAKSLAADSTGATPEPKPEGQQPGELKTAAKSTKCVKCDKAGDPAKMRPNPDGAGYLCKPSCGPWPKDKTAKCDCGGHCQCGGGGSRGGDCDCGKAGKTAADNAEVSAMAREVVMGWMAEHPGQPLDLTHTYFTTAWNDNKTVCPDQNAFVRAVQTAAGELTRKKSSHVAALMIQAMGLMGPTAEEGDSVANATKFIHGNASEIEDQTVAELRQTLADAGYGRMIVETAIAEVFGDEALLANGATLKDLLKQ